MRSRACCRVTASRALRCGAPLCKQQWQCMSALLVRSCPACCPDHHALASGQHKVPCVCLAVCLRSWCAAALILKHSRSHGQHTMYACTSVLITAADGRTADGLAAEVSDAPSRFVNASTFSRSALQPTTAAEVVCQPLERARIPRVMRRPSQSVCLSSGQLTKGGRSEGELLWLQPFQGCTNRCNAQARSNPRNTMIHNVQTCKLHMQDSPTKTRGTILWPRPRIFSTQTQHKQKSNIYEAIQY